MPPPLLQNRSSCLVPKPSAEATARRSRACCAMLRYTSDVPGSGVERPCWRREYVAGWNLEAK